MSETIRLRIPGVPIAQPRAKATSRAGFTRMYTPHKTTTGNSNGVAEFKALVKQIAAAEYRDAPMSCPVTIDCTWVFPRESACIWKTKPMPRYPHVVKPDRDNLDKMILDSLVGVVLVDDNQVFAGRLEKWRAAGDEQPHVLITIRPIEPA